MAQLVFGALMPGNTLANTAAAGLSGSTAAASADLLTDVKAGSLLGVLPRQTFLAQLWGCLVGSVVLVPAFLLLVPDSSVLSEERFQAPGGCSWRASPGCFEHPRLHTSWVDQGDRYQPPLPRGA